MYGDSADVARRAVISCADGLEDAEYAMRAALAALAESPTTEAVEALQAAHATRDEAAAVPRETSGRLERAERSARHGS